MTAYEMTLTPTVTPVASVGVDVFPVLALIGVASRMLVETQAPDPGHDLPLDPRAPLEVGAGTVIAVFALYAGFRALRDIKLR